MNNKLVCKKCKKRSIGNKYKEYNICNYSLSFKSDQKTKYPNLFKFVVI